MGKKLSYDEIIELARKYHEPIFGFEKYIDLSNNDKLFPYINNETCNDITIKRCILRAMDKLNYKVRDKLETCSTSELIEDKASLRILSAVFLTAYCRGYNPDIYDTLLPYNDDVETKRAIAAGDLEAALQYVARFIKQYVMATDSYRSAVEIEKEEALELERIKKNLKKRGRKNNNNNEASR